MQPPATPNLQQARRSAAGRYLAIADLLKQEAGISEHIVRAELSGRAWRKSRRIAAPEGRTREQLYILAHECAHIAIPHRGKPVHVRELEAEQWAHEALRRHGVAVPRAMTERAQRYVASKISRAAKRGARNVDPRAVQFAQGAALKSKPAAVERWCRQYGVTEARFLLFLQSWASRFVRIEDGDGGLTRWVALNMDCPDREAAAALHWACLYPSKSTPPQSVYVPEI